LNGFDDRIEDELERCGQRALRRRGGGGCGALFVALLQIVEVEQLARILCLCLRLLG
jgi:hypothetical protein